MFEVSIDFSLYINQNNMLDDGESRI